MFGNKPKLEGPVAPLIGAFIGGAGGYAAAGTLGMTALAATAAGASLGATAGTLLSPPKMPSMPAVQMPQMPGATGMPGATEMPTAGLSSPVTGSSLSKGELESTKRRGRVSTILSKATGSEEIERLGG